MGLVSKLKKKGESSPKDTNLPNEGKKSGWANFYKDRLKSEGVKDEDISMKKNGGKYPGNGAGSRVVRDDDDVPKKKRRAS